MGEWIECPVLEWRGPGIHPTARVGGWPELRDGCDEPLPVLIHETATVGAGSSVDAGSFRNTRIGARSWVMKQCHLGHDVVIGEDCELSPNCTVGGEVTVGNGVRIGMGAEIKPRVTIGDGARIGMSAVVTKNVAAGEVWYGNPARPKLSRNCDRCGALTNSIVFTGSGKTRVSRCPNCSSENCAPGTRMIEARDDSLRPGRSIGFPRGAA